jgi:hypothetical protein
VLHLWYRQPQAMTRMKTNIRPTSSPRQPFRSSLIKHQRQILGGVIFIIGLSLAFIFNSLAVIADLNGAGFWGDSQDAAAFDREKPTQAELVKIRCPILLAPGEEGNITATFQNPNQEKAEILVKAVVSEGDYVNYRVVTSSLPIESGEEQDFRWQISEQDIIARNFILTRVFLMNQEQVIPYPARTDSCGIFIVNIFGLKGVWIVALMFAVSLISLVAGSILLYRRDSALQKSSPRLDFGLYGLAGIVLTGMTANLLGWWILAGLLLLLAILLTSILFFNLLNLRA